MLDTFTSQKGKPKVRHLEYIFLKQGDGAGGKQIWRCEEYKKKCTARLHTQDENIILEIGRHSHDPPIGKANVIKVRQEMKEKARSTEESTRQIINNSLLNLSPNNSNLTSSRATISRDIRRHRQQATQQKFDLGILKKTIIGGAFMREENEDLVVMASDFQLDLLERSKHWFADGTFRVAPDGFEQLYTIHALSNGGSHACVYALMSKRSAVAYNRLLNCIHSLIPRCAPETIVTDFEKAAMNAFEKQFPSASLTGCFFHLAQNLWRRVQETGLQSRYTMDKNFSEKVKSLVALCFVPIEDVVQLFEDFSADNRDEQYQPLLDYFEENYIGKRTRNGRFRARFNPRIWNQHKRVIDNLPRTNNSIEAWHNAFNTVVSIAHPTFKKLVIKLRAEAHSMELFYRQHSLSTSQGNKGKPIYIRLTEVIRKHVQEYHQVEPLKFLQNIAAILQINTH